MNSSKVSGYKSAEQFFPCQDLGPFSMRGQTRLFIFNDYCK